MKIHTFIRDAKAMARNERDTLMLRRAASVPGNVVPNTQKELSATVSVTKLQEKEKRREGGRKKKDQAKV